MTSFLVVSNSYGQEKDVKDCFEKINRATFAFNMALDKVLFRPVATGYRKLPSPIRTGTSNALNNLSNLVTIPNNILQGDFLAAGNNSIRFIINTTIGIVGIFLNRKNVIVLLMSVELILIAVNINLVAFSVYLQDIVGQVFTMFVLTVAAGEAAIGLAILVVFFRNKGSIHVEDINTLKG